MRDGSEGDRDSHPRSRGYGLPPVEHQFVKGAPSPNPFGRPRGSRNRSALTRRVALEARQYSEGNRRKTSTNIELVIKTVRNSAAKGDLLAIALYDWLEGQRKPEEELVQKAVFFAYEKLTIEEWEEKYSHLGEG